MRIGMVCEGATDFITISSFLTESLTAHGIDVEFIDIQPGLDRTSEMNCGWSNALLWLHRNSLSNRRSAYLGRGLFSNRLAVKKCDVLLVAIDADCVLDPGFSRFLAKKGYRGMGAAADLKPEEFAVRALEEGLINGFGCADIAA